MNGRPLWRVRRALTRPGWWVALRTKGPRWAGSGRLFPTWREAYDYADQMARRQA